MTENKSNVVKDIIAMITERKNSAEIKERTATDNYHLHMYAATTWTLMQVLKDIEDILYIHEKHQRELDEQEEIDRIDDLEWHSNYGEEY